MALESDALLPDDWESESSDGDMPGPRSLEAQDKDVEVAEVAPPDEEAEEPVNADKPGADDTAAEDQEEAEQDTLRAEEDQAAEETLEQARDGGEAVQGPKGSQTNTRQNMDYEVALTLMTEDQINRYESYRRSAIPRKNMKRLAQSMAGQTINDNMAIVLCGITKIFVGDLIEYARIIANNTGHTGALLPSHVQAAFQQLDREGRVPHKGVQKRVRL